MKHTTIILPANENHLFRTILFVPPPREMSIQKGGISGSEHRISDTGIVNTLYPENGSRSRPKRTKDDSNCRI
jgi:hypothetical protein